jgi:hypothetical protein
MPWAMFVGGNASDGGGVSVFRASTESMSFVLLSPSFTGAQDSGGGVRVASASLFSSSTVVIKKKEQKLLKKKNKSDFSQTIPRQIIYRPLHTSDFQIQSQHVLQLKITQEVPQKYQHSTLQNEQRKAHQFIQSEAEIDSISRRPSFSLINCSTRI